MDKSVLGFGMATDVCVLMFAILLIISLVAYFKGSYTKKVYIEKLTLEPKIVEHKYEDYVVLEIFNLLTQDECKEIIDYSIKKGMKESDVLSYSSSTGAEVNDNYRKSKTAWLRDEEHPIVMKLAQYSQQITGIPIENQEMLQVAHYEPNGKFNEHYDSCVYDDKDYCERMNNYAGQRRSTLLIYLNDDFEGGETEFVDIGLKIKPETGKAILFWNVDADEKLYVKSRHAGNPVIKGEKWICTKWSHTRKYNK